MQIAMLGNFRVDYTSESHYKKSLESLGHNIIALQESEADYIQILAAAKDSDVFVWLHTHGWETHGILEVLKELNLRKIPSVAYHLDLYMGLDRWRDYKDHDYFRVQHFFTVDALMAKWLNENTETEGHFLPAGVFHEDCYAAPSSGFKHDIVFTGSRSYHKEWPYRGKLLDWLKATYGDRFAHYGNDGIKVVRGAELNQLYADSKIVIGDSLCPNFSYPSYSSDRLFEVPGRGGFLIYPKIRGLSKYFKPDKEVVFYDFDNANDLKDKIDFYLMRDNIREQIRRAGHERAKKDHTYKLRWKKILDTIK